MWTQVPPGGLDGLLWWQWETSFSRCGPSFSFLRLFNCISSQKKNGRKTIPARHTCDRKLADRTNFSRRSACKTKWSTKQRLFILLFPWQRIDKKWGKCATPQTNGTHENAQSVENSINENAKNRQEPNSEFRVNFYTQKKMSAERLFRADGLVTWWRPRQVIGSGVVTWLFFRFFGGNEWTADGMRRRRRGSAEWGGVRRRK